MRSKHAESARRELLARDRHRPLGEDEIEAELARLQVVFSIEDPTVAINSVSLKLALFAYELSFFFDPYAIFVTLLELDLFLWKCVRGTDFDIILQIRSEHY